MTVEKVELFFLVYDGIISSSVFESQVLGLIKNLSKGENLKITLIAFENIKLFFWQYKKLSDIKKHFKNFKVHTLFLPRCSGKIGLFINGVFLFFYFLTKIIFGRKEKIIFHCRGCKASFIGINLKKFFPQIKVISDQRGLEAEEYLLSQAYKNIKSKKNTLDRYEWFKVCEKKSLKESDHIFCVSGKYKEYLTKEYSIMSEKISVIPCGFDSSIFNFHQEIREKVRKQLKLKNNLVFVYSGSLAFYQMPEVVVLFFKRFLEYDDSACLLFLTNQVSVAEKLIAKEMIPKSNYLVLQLNHEEVARYLMAADVGFLLRKEDLMNKVACPVKFSEYVSCGLHPILTQGLGDLTEIVRKRDIGSIMEDFSDLNIDLMVKNIINKKGEIQDESIKSRVARLALELFSWEELVPIIYKNYECLFDKPSENPGQETQRQSQVFQE